MARRLRPVVSYDLFARTLRLVRTHPMLFTLALAVLVFILYSDRSKFIIYDVQIFDLPPKMTQPPHLTPLNPTTLLPRGYVTLDAAHRSGRIHTGSWIFVVDNADNLLLLRRGPDLVTCPLSWSMVGEHAYRDESAVDTLRRGISEELGQDTWKSIVNSGRYYNLTELPIFYFREYGPEREGRIDRQVTYLWLVELGISSGEADEVLRVDDEVYEYKWMPIDEAEEWVKLDLEARMDGRKIKSFCHDTIGSLMLLGFENIRALRTGG